MTILMQVTHEKYKRVAVFVKSFLMVKLKLRNTKVYLFVLKLQIYSSLYDH